MSYKAKMTLAKILFFISFCLMIIGLVTSISESTNINLNDVIPLANDGEEIHVTTSDRTPIHTGDSYSEDNPKTDNNTKSNDTKTSDTKTNTNSNTNNSNKSNKSNNSNSGSQNNKSLPSNNTSNGNTVIVVPTSDPNNNLRNSIQSTYGITVKYGSETNGYNVGGLSTTPINDANNISRALNDLNSCLSKYPSGFFQEMRNGGMPLTVYLISHYSQAGVTGVTDSNYSRAIISIACDYSFPESFHHENFHYIERYINKYGGFFNNWNRFNPNGFTYNDINDSLSYTRNGYSPDSFFVNNYAQTHETEDRASTFEYMTGDYKASCLNYGKPIWYKSVEMATYIQNYFNTVNSGTVEFWERFL